MPVAREQSSWLAHVPEPTSDTLTRASPFELAITSFASSSQLDSATLSSVTISDYIGNWLEFLDGNVAGEWARIRTFDGTNTVTIDPVTNAAPSATRARMWVPPEPLVPVTAGGSSTTVVSASRTEGDDYWNDPDRLYLVVEGGGGAGTAARGDAPRLITDFVAASDTFTVSPDFPATPTVGDLLVIRQPLKPMAAELPYAQIGIQWIGRKFVKSTWDRDPGVVGPRGGQPLDISLEALGASTAGSGGVGALAPLEAHDLLNSILYNARGNGIATGLGDGSSTVGAGSTTGAVTIPSGHRERFTIGNAILVEGAVTLITGTTDGGAGLDTLTISPGLPVIPTVGAAVTGGVNYRPRNNATAAWVGLLTASAADPSVVVQASAGGFRSHTIEAYLNGMRKLYYGWHFDLEIGGLSQNAIPSLKFTGPQDNCMVQSIANLYAPTFTTAVPRPSKASRAVIGGTTYSTVLEASVKVGYEIQPITSVAGTAHGRNGHMVTGRMTAGTMRIWMEDAAQWNLWERAAEQTLVLQVGSVTAGTVAFVAPAIQYTGVELTRESGGFTANIAFDVLRSNIASVDDFTYVAI